MLDRTIDKDNNGFYVLDNLNPVVGQKLANHANVIPLIINGNKYFFKSYKPTYNEDLACMANGNMRMLSEIYVSKFFARVSDVLRQKYRPNCGLGNVKYQLARLGCNYGVISPDCHQLIPSDATVEDFGFVIPSTEQMHLKHLYKKKFFSKSTPNMLEDFQTKVLLDYCTGSLDAYYRNIVIVQSQQGEYCRLLGMDYSDTLAGMFGRVEDEQFSKHLNGKWCVRFGIEESDIDNYLFLEDVEMSPYIRSSVIETVLDLLQGDNSNNLIDSIHGEVVEEYGREDQYLELFRNRFGQTLNCNTDNLGASLSYRQVEKDLEF